MTQSFSRRQVLAASGAALGGVLAGSLCEAQPDAPMPRRERARFRYSLNTSTIRRDDLDLVAKIDMAHQAGYDAIEPWINEIDAYIKKGGALADLRKRIADAGLSVESAIGFAPWIVDDPEKRRQGLEQLKREMDWLAQIGGKRIAAPPAGATNQANLPLLTVAERYRTILDLGDATGITPQVEIWGPSKVLSRLGEAAYVAIESGHPKACILPDIYHLYRGGSDFTGLSLLGANTIHAIHVNDYPASPPREKMTDALRVYPGDGVAPLGEIFRTLAAIGFNGVLSLELFNRDYWKQDLLGVARTGLEKTRAAVQKALG